MSARYVSPPRALAMLAIVVGGAGSLALMLRAGSRNPSLLLIAVFAVWVLAPFVGLGIAQKRSERWPDLARGMLYAAILIIAAGSLIIYYNVLMHPPRKAAFPFLVVPLASWIVMAVVIGVVSRLSRRGVA
jgi:hypothetical protein